MRKLRKKCWIYLLLLFVNLSSLDAENEKQKRQIFREQVLPALGGKIPEEAFRSDRLALNRLNKEGITVPDGVVFDARRVVKYSDSVMSKPDLIKVYLTPDGRYVPPEGRFRYNGPKTVDTTYVIRMPIDYHKSHHQKPPNAQNVYKPHAFSKPQGYANYHKSLPTDSQFYKPIISPFVLPSRDDIMGETYFPQIWHFGSDWDLLYSPYNSFYFDKLTLFDSKPVIANYQGIVHNFHGRSLRHIENEKPHSQVLNAFTDKSKSPKIQMNVHATQNKSKNIPATATSGYTALTKIPETAFTCAGRTGTFADVETKCQVFHECTTWSKTASLCPQGTAYSEAKKRCEWWHEVICH